MTRTPNQPHSRFSPLRCSLVALACALCWTLAARPAAQDARPVFHAATELVRLDVSITDRNGHPVPDVRPEEIRVTENGRTRPIVLFRHIAGAEPGDAPEASRFEELSRNEVTASGHLYVLVFDQLHIATGHEQRARLAAERFLARQLKPGDAVAIYGLPGPGPSVNLTTDLIGARARLLEVRGKAGRPRGGVSDFDAYRVARGGYGVSDAMEMGRPSDLIADAAMPPAGPSSGADRSAAGEALRERASEVVAQADTEGQIFLAELAGVMRRLRWVDGRKAFILFSEGFFIDNLAPQLEQVASAAAQSHSIVYAIDLNASQVGGTSALPISAGELSGRRDPLATLATETNGRLVTGATDLDSILSQIAAETTDYYLVGFEPSASDAPHDYHRVKVNVTRRGLVARARTGYSTTPESSPVADRQAIDVALAFPRASSALPIEYTTYERSGASADRPAIIVSATARVPCSRVADQSASVVFVVRDAVTGQAAASGTDRVPLPASCDAAAGRLDAVHYAVQFDVPPGEYWMRMLVREPGGVIGTADRRFHVWSLDGATLSTSDLIVSRLDGPRFDPPPLATVRHDDEVLAYLEMYGTPAAVQSADARVDIVRANSEQVVATVDALVKPGQHGEKIVRARLPVSSLSEGEYAARVRIVVPHQSARTITRNFRIVSADGQ